MGLTPYADLDGLLNGLLGEMRSILSSRLVGLYLYGSLVAGDFDRNSSDIDLLAVTSSGIDGEEFARSRKMHADFASKNREWDGRLEIAYVPADALKTYRTRPSEIAVISPGEPFHLKEAANDWLINWRMVREQGVAIFGPPPAAFIDPISKEEFLGAVREQAKDWRVWVHHAARERKGQAYTILTMCRALYAWENGKQASKREAARWAQERLPQWASLIRNALAWRDAWRDEEVAEDNAATFPETVRFVNFVVDQIVS